MAAADGKEMILVPKEEYEELRKLKADLPAMLEKAKRREDPEKHRERSKKQYAANKDTILAKRREAYQKKKAAVAEAAPK